MRQVSLTIFIIITALLTPMTTKSPGLIAPTAEILKVLEVYPATIGDDIRHVILVEEISDEALYKLEVTAGKIMLVDCNLHTLLGKFKIESLDARHSYYKFETDGSVFSTSRGCLTPKEHEFVSSSILSIGYNSSLLLVIYSPNNLQLKYRIVKEEME